LDRRFSVARLRVPERFRAGIASIGNLTEEAFQQLFNALKKAPEFNDASELLAWISDETPAIRAASREPILAAMTSMTKAHANGDSSVADFAVDIWNAISEDSPHLVKGLDEATFEARISSLVERVALDLPRAKADDLRSEIERTYCDARIMTDLRAGFRKTIDDSVSMMVVLHNLRIGYHDDKGDHREFYLTLDAKDLKDLKKAVERAQKKSKTLHDAMKAANITVIE
jgi:hypothetical protein